MHISLSQQHNRGLQMELPPLSIVHCAGIFMGMNISNLSNLPGPVQLLQPGDPAATELATVPIGMAHGPSNSMNVTYMLPNLPLAGKPVLRMRSTSSGWISNVTASVTLTWLPVTTGAALAQSPLSPLPFHCSTRPSVPSPLSLSVRTSASCILSWLAGSRGLNYSSLLRMDCQGSSDLHVVLYGDMFDASSAVRSSGHGYIIKGTCRTYIGARQLHPETLGRDSLLYA